MSIATEITEVETEDSAPLAPPYRISAKPSKSTLIFHWATTARHTIRAWRVRVKPLNRNSGKLIDKRGIVCGSGDHCGEPKARSLATTSPLERATTVLESDVASEPDGEIEVAVWAMSAEDGWSS